jgi:hypothetical protein
MGSSLAVNLRSEVGQKGEMEGDAGQNPVAERCRQSSPGNLLLDRFCVQNLVLQPHTKKEAREQVGRETHTVRTRLHRPLTPHRITVRGRFGVGELPVRWRIV